MSYTAESIAVLKGLEPVRHRPGMYTRTDCPLHIIQEAIDNAADEALGGYCKRITVILHRDHSVTVQDDGRGIPVEMHPLEKVPTVEVVFTRLHAGGKFNKDDQASAYRFSGGLHGVGVSVTNALSTRLEVEVVRDGARHQMAFAGGEVIEPLRRVGDAPKRASGTRVRAWPDPAFFDSPNVPLPQLERLLRSKALLLPGLQVALTVEDGASERVVFRPGHAAVSGRAARRRGGGTGVQQREIRRQGRRELSRRLGRRLGDLLDGRGRGGTRILRQPDPDDGRRHARGRLAAGGARRHTQLRRAPRAVAEGGQAGGRGRLCARQLRARGAHARSLVPGADQGAAELARCRGARRAHGARPLELWLNEHPEAAKRITELAIRAAQARTRAGQKVEKRKQSGVAILPGKLSDCQSEDVNRNEIFLVEGDSAGGSAKSGRDKELQAILPLRGKVLNTWEVEAGSLFANREVHDIAVALGIDPHPPSAPDSVLTNLRYGKVVIMTDADVDGSHIRVLLCTLFYRHFPKLIARGHLYFAQPPLYRLDVPGQGKNRPPRKIYALDSAEREASIDRLRLEGVKPEAISISRFKGLGEMNPEQLWETTMSPDTRRLMRIRMPGTEAAKPVMNMLMAKGESAGRRAWMEENGAMIGAEI
jgi:topoisomerase-4 subunit B